MSKKEDVYIDAVDAVEKAQSEVKRVHEQIERVSAKIDSTVSTIQSLENKGKVDTLLSLSITQLLEKIKSDLAKTKGVL